MASEDARDQRVSLHPLDPREALKALLGTKPQNGGGDPKPRSGSKPKEPDRRPSRE